MMYWPWSSTRWMRASMLSFSSRYSVFRSTKSIRKPFLTGLEQFGRGRPYAPDVQRDQAVAHLAAAAPVQAARPAGIFISGDDAVPAGTRHAPGSPKICAGGSEDRHCRGTDCRGDMHRRGIDADEEPRARSERRQLLERELAGEVRRHGLRNATQNLFDHLRFGVVGRGREYDAAALAMQPVDQRSHLVRR